MNDRPSQNLTLDEFLVAINACDLEGNYVVPKDGVCEKLAHEIEQRTGIKSSNLAGEDGRGMEHYKTWISAKPGEFITRTRLAVEEICVRLTVRRAKTFDIAFHNTRQRPNEWGDKVLLAVRYECAAQGER